jgi:hypothetical protein
MTDTWVSVFLSFFLSIFIFLAAGAYEFLSDICSEDATDRQDAGDSTGGIGLWTAAV